MVKRKEFWEKSAEAYLKKGRYASRSLQRAMNEEAIELMQGNDYTQKFAADIKRIKERIHKPQSNEKQAIVLEDAKKLRRNRIEYADKFKEDVEKIRKRIYSK